MSEPPKNEKRDEVLRRMLTTPPKQHDEMPTPRSKKRAKQDIESKEGSNVAKVQRGKSPI